MHTLRTSSAPSRLVLRLLGGAAACALVAAPAFAQDDLDYDTEVEELVITAARGLPGEVIGDIKPELMLTAREIRAYGASNVTELLEALAPQTSSGQGGGRPVTLINGARPASFAEIRDLPTEAIIRVDILPEEVSLKYGYPAEQKVVNIVLRERFRAWIGEAGGRVPTQGDGASVEAKLSNLRIRDGRRLMLNAEVKHTDPILEGDRDIAGGQGAYRSLQGESDSLSLNAVLAQPIGNGISGTINGSYEASQGESRLGLSPFGPEALLRQTESQSGSLSGALAGAYAGWQWSSTGELSRSVSESETDRAVGLVGYTDWTRSINTSAKADVVASRSLWELPAGDVSTSLTARASTTKLESESRRAGVEQSKDLSRSIGQVQANFDVPLTLDGEGVGAAIGKLSANVNLGYQELSDYGGLTTLGYGANWTPIDGLRVIAAFSRTDEAPSMSQLGDPTTVTPGVRVFDLRTGQTVEVTQVSGGSPDLTGGQRDVIKLGASYKPLSDVNLNLQANYTSTRTYDGVASFPSASTQVEDAFPERFVRDDTGALIQIDTRPVNFQRQARDELRYGFTYSRPIGPQPNPEAMAEARRRAAEARAAQASQAGQGQEGQAQPGQGQAQTPGAQAPGGQGVPAGERPPMGERPPGGFGGPGGGGGFGAGPGGGGFRGGGFGGGRGARGGNFQVGVYHTVAFRDDVLIRDGIPELDLLDGGAIGAGGGSPRHQVDLQTNLSKGGLGVSANAKWQSGTRVIGDVGEETLDFSDMTTVNLRLFADIGMQPFARPYPWLRGVRATLSVNNIFDERQDVTTAAGAVPVRYQPDLLDPVGRSVRFTIRKLLF